MEKMDYLIESVQVHSLKGKDPLPSMKRTSVSPGFEAQLQREINGRGTQGSSSTAAVSNHGSAERGLIRVGTISREHPTVSHLLISHPDYKGDCWKIIHETVNAQKPFHTLRPGEAIFIDPVTREISWGERAGSPSGETATAKAASFGIAPGPPVTEQKELFSQEGGKADRGIARTGFDAGGLASILKQHIGTPYQRLDCYELVVEGLKEMGVRYSGAGGMQDYLIHAAASQGLPMNALLTGNGLIEASSTTVYDRTVGGTEGPSNSVEEVWKDLEPCLEKGLIVSFSIGDRGHTGVTSRYGDAWTFLNSGDIDHDVRTESRRKGVGEEDLKSEIKNWLRRAGRWDHPLRITLGRLNSEKLASFLGETSTRRVA